LAFEIKKQRQLNKIIVIPSVLSATGIIADMLNQSLTALNLPPCLPFQSQKADVPNTYCIVPEFLNDDVHIPDEEADNFQPRHFTMFPNLYSHFNIP
jgi:hypothetical protein